MGDKSPSQTPAAPARVPAPAIAPPTGLEDQNQMGNAAVQAQLAAGGGGGAGTPTLAAASKKLAGGDAGKGQEVTQHSDTAAIHLLKWKWKEHNRVTVSFDLETLQGVEAARFDYIEGFQYAQINFGGKVMVSRMGAEALLQEVLRTVGRLIMKQAGTGALRLPPGQQQKILDKIVEVRAAIEKAYHTDITPAPPEGAGNRMKWEESVYEGAWRDESKVQPDRPGPRAEGTHITGADSGMKTGTGTPPDVGPPVEKPPAKPPAPPAPPGEKKPEPAPLPAPLSIQFAQGKWNADTKALAALQPWCNADHEFDVVGYASAEGTAAYNVELSVRRAMFVKNALSQLGAVTLHPAGLGEEGTQELGASEKGRAGKEKQAVREKWRRVDVTVSRKPPKPPR